MPEKNESDILEAAIGWTLIAFSVLLLCILTYKSIYVPIDYDEAYNLQIVDSLFKGDGYASYGALRGSGPWLFDPHITTGPAILIPLAAVWAVSDESILAVRIFMASFLWVYAASLYFLFKRSNNRLVLFALSIAAFLCIQNLQAGKVLGELPAAAALIVAATLVSQNKYIMAALAVGIAIQIKLVYGLAGLIVLSSISIYWIFLRREVKIKTVLFAAVFAIGPSALFELLRYLSFYDFNSYLYSIDEFDSFLRTQNINNTGTWLDSSSLGAKLSGLYQSMSPFAWIAAGLATMSVILSSNIGMATTTSTNDNQPKESTNKYGGDLNEAVRIILAILIFAGIAMLGGWITQSNQPVARHGLPFLFLFMPAVSVLGGSFFIALRRQSETRKSLFGSSFLLLLSGLFLVSLVLIIQSSVEKDTTSYLADQTRVARILKVENPKSLFADGWWQSPEYQVLTKIPAVPYKTGDSQMLVVQDYQVNLLNSNWEIYEGICSRIVYSSPWNLVCWLPEHKYPDVSLKSLDWGPRNTEIGYVPNTQPDGGAGIWIKIKKVDPQAIGPVKIYFDGVPSRVDYLHPDGELITASLPPRLFKTAGSYEVTLRQIATGRSFHVGYFIVK